MQLIEKIDFRTIYVNDNGQKKPIHFGVKMGEKEDISLWLKLLRYPNRKISDFHDLTRGRFLFKTKEDQDLALTEIMQRLDQSKGGGDPTKPRLAYIDKTTIGGPRGEKIPIPLIKMNITVGYNGKECKLETHSLLLTDYIDYICWKPWSWDTFSVERLRDVLRMFWPQMEPILDQVIERAANDKYERTIKIRGQLPFTY